MVWTVLNLLQWICIWKFSEKLKITTFTVQYYSYILCSDQSYRFVWLNNDQLSSKTMEKGMKRYTHLYWKETKYIPKGYSKSSDENALTKTTKRQYKVQHRKPDWATRTLSKASNDVRFLKIITQILLAYVAPVVFLM